MRGKLRGVDDGCRVGVDSEGGTSDRYGCEEGEYVDGCGLGSTGNLKPEGFSAAASVDGPAEDR